MSEYNITSARFEKFFKDTFGKRADATYNMKYPFMARIKKTSDFIGRNKILAVQLERSGSTAFGSLPEVNTAKIEDVILSRKKSYARYIVDRETLVTGVADAGAFEDSQKFIIKSTIDSYVNTEMRQCFGNGELGTIASIVDNGGGNYDLVISTATWKEANFEEGEHINIETGNTDLFLIESVDPATKTIVVQRQTGSQAPAATDQIFLQKSEGNTFTGLQTVLTATSGSLYGVPVQRRWQAYQRNASAGAVSETFLSDAILDMSKATGEAPTAIYMSYDQGKKYLAGLTKPVYEVSRNVKVTSGGYTASYSALHILSPASPNAIPIFIDRYVPDKEIWLLNEPRIVMYQAPKHGWFTEDGLFARVAGEDQYEARYGGYKELYIQPSYQGRIHNLA